MITVCRVRFELFPGNGDEVEPITFDGQNLTVVPTTKFDQSKLMKVTIDVFSQLMIVMCEDETSKSDFL